VPVIHRLIRELAEYEGALAEVTATEDDLRAALFGPGAAVFAHVAEHDGAGPQDAAQQDAGPDGGPDAGPDGGVVAGFALWFLSYSTWTGRAGIYLEDLYVTQALRRSGLGRALLAELAAICVRRGYTRLEWSVLDWNAPSLAFYAALGARYQESWRPHRLSGPALSALAGQAPAQAAQA
jgi:GNAT superfamily N-acetyltransferase